MLRLCLTVSVLFGHSFAGKERYQEAIDFCEGNDCPEPKVLILYNNYEEMEFAGLKWIETDVHGLDMKSAVTTGLDRLFKYSRFSNAADTIVPITAPWGLIGSLVNGTIQPVFRVFVFRPLALTSPPEPTDPTVKLGAFPPAWYYVRAFDTKVDDQQYEGLILDLLKDLDDDKQPFDSSTFYIIFFNRDGLMQLSFKKKEE